MSYEFTIYSAFFFVTTLISFFVAFLAWQRRMVKGAKELALLMIAAGIWTFWLVLETASTAMTQKILWAGFEYIGAVSAPVLYLIFVFRFTGREKFITPKNIVLLFIIPVIILFLALTNEKHHLIWSGFSPISEKTNMMQYYHGIGFWTGYMAYNNLLLFLASLYLFSFIINLKKIFRIQGLLVLIAGLFPWITSVIYLSGINFTPGLDITPASIILSGSLFTFAILYFRFLDLVPVARKTLVETMQDGILALDAQNRIQDINEAALTFLGISNKTIIGISAEFLEATHTRLLNAILDEESIDQVEIKIGEENKTFNILKHSISSLPGSRLIVIRDTTKQVLRQKEIEAAKERYHSLFNMFRLITDNSEDFLWAKDINNQYIFANKTMCDRLLIANSVDEPIGKTDIFFATREREKHPENPDWHTFGEICIDSDKIIRTERTPQQFDEFGYVQGKFLYLDVHKAPIFDEAGNLVGVVGTARDVTQTKKLEKEKSDALKSLQTSENSLRKLNAEKDKFFSIIAHDLRGPLSSFLGLSRVMAENLPDFTKDELQVMTTSMCKSATNLYGLLENLLEWSRIQRNIIGFNPKSFLVMPNIQENILSVLELARTKSITIDLDVPENLHVFADEYMFGSTMRNFVSNAVKFTHKGGKIVITAKKVSEEFVEISVRDNGIGMNPDLLQKLFKLDENTRRNGTNGEPSTGLGLLLCKELIEKNGGKIWVESEDGNGSVFYFTVPWNTVQANGLWIGRR